jgi:hypothetical protein
VCRHRGFAPNVTDSSVVEDLADKALARTAETKGSRKLRQTAEAQTRALTSATFVARGINPTLMERTIGDAALMGVVETLRQVGKPFGTTAVTTTDVVFADEMLQDELTNVLAGSVGAIGSDSAGLRHDKAVAINYLTHKGSFLLTLVWPNDQDFPEDYMPVKADFVYDVPKAAADIRAACQRVKIDINTQVRFVSFVLARAHILQLQSVALFPCSVLASLVTTLSLTMRLPVS